MPLIEHGENPQTGCGGLDNLKAAKLDELKIRFADAERDGIVLSSLGFTVDANDVANRNVEGLIKVLTVTGKDTTMFCDHQNTMREVTLEQLKTLQIEIIHYGQQLYAQKWRLREAVNAATTADEINAIRWE